eukprot:scaffold310306_cov35-Tisochrysis_lutea.AAC.1
MTFTLGAPRPLTHSAAWHASACRNSPSRKFEESQRPGPTGIAPGTSARSCRATIWLSATSPPLCSVEEASTGPNISRASSVTTAPTFVSSGLLMTTPTTESSVTDVIRMTARWRLGCIMQANGWVRRSEPGRTTSPAATRTSGRMAASHLFASIRCCDTASARSAASPSTRSAASPTSRGRSAGGERRTARTAVSSDRSGR